MYYARLLSSLVLAFAPVAVDAGFFSRLASMRVEGEGESKEAMSGLTVEQGVAHSLLLNNSKIPLVGFGVGHVHPEVVASMVAESIQEDKKTRLIDTSQVSGTEAYVAHGILHGVERMPLTEKLQVHVVTKIWYTHLGYERTKLAVEESLRAFDSVIKSGKVDLRLHFLLHWPKCFKTAWECSYDEANLPMQVRQAGGDPNRNTESAWKESWRALEDYYLSEHYPIESIGLANFLLHHLVEIRSFARVSPSILQVNLWSLMYDHELIGYCYGQGIRLQVYNIMEGTLSQPENAPHAYHHIQNVAVSLSTLAGVDHFTPVQVLFAWLIQHGVSIVPAPSSKMILAEDSAVAITSLPTFDDVQCETIAHAVEAYLSGKDMEQDTSVRVIFHAVNKDMMVYWLTDIDEVKVALVRVGQQYNETSYPGHVYRLYDAKNKDIYIDHVVQPHVGLQEVIHVDLQSLGLSSHRETAAGMGRAGQDTAGYKQPTSVLDWLGGVLHGGKK